MIKRVLSSLAAVAFVFGAFSRVNVLHNVSDACSYACCDHNGAGWDN